jgi:hypothetical protein
MPLPKEEQGWGEEADCFSLPLNADDGIYTKVGARIKISKAGILTGRHVSQGESGDLYRSPKPQSKAIFKEIRVPSVVAIHFGFGAGVGFARFIG